MSEIRIGKKCLNCGACMREDDILGMFCTECCRIQYFSKGDCE